MKKLWFALALTTCLVIMPVSVIAEETDYSYLEDMSVKQLKELRDAINKILGEENNTAKSNSTEAEVTEEIFLDSKNAYDKLVYASEIGLNALADIYSAWYYGINEDIDNVSFYSYCADLNVSAYDVQKGIEKYDDFYAYVISDEEVKQKHAQTMADYFKFMSYGKEFWQDCVFYIIDAYLAKEIDGFNDMSQALNDAKGSLKNVGEKYSDYEYYPNLKEFYSEVSSLYEFVSSPTGSFEALTTTINNYRTSIRKYTADLSFIFEEE